MAPRGRAPNLTPVRFSVYDRKQLFAEPFFAHGRRFCSTAWVKRITWTQPMANLPSMLPEIFTARQPLGARRLTVPSLNSAAPAAVGPERFYTTFRLTT